MTSGTTLTLGSNLQEANTLTLRRRVAKYVELQTEVSRQNVLTTDPENVRYSIQQGEVRSRGIEFEAAVQPMRGLKLLAALTYNPVKVTRAQPDQWGGNVQGKSPYEVPRKMASALSRRSSLPRTPPGPPCRPSGPTASSAGKRCGTSGRYT